ncbi:MAG: hypothetical protein HND27_05950 [Bacteroidetes bacterium]|nr:hypothetical protein [Flavobacteriales bacterium]NOG95304.1 hypothetical protein [Bacteroidota bacterium]WKZ76445.1 MAG: hypothetical protein QY303_05985 [Vicingaceae bacterium]MCL4816368.1 hypothetical protein [Flavobacteriales bacterium]CAG1000053.1 hypothetical protein FLAV_02889 [Flavobacteriales bacterium]
MEKYSTLEKIGFVGILLLSVLNVILLLNDKFTPYIFVPLLPLIMLIWAGRDYRKNKR